MSEPHQLTPKQTEYITAVLKEAGFTVTSAAPFDYNRRLEVCCIIPGSAPARQRCVGIRSDDYGDGWLTDLAQFEAMVADAVLGFRPMWKL